VDAVRLAVSPAVQDVRDRLLGDDLEREVPVEGGRGHEVGGGQRGTVRATDQRLGHGAPADGRRRVAVAEDHRAVPRGAARDRLVEARWHDVVDPGYVDRVRVPGHALGQRTQRAIVAAEQADAPGSA
jgi:hypothetical protein